MTRRAMRGRVVMAEHGGARGRGWRAVRLALCAAVAALLAPTAHAAAQESDGASGSSPVGASRHRGSLELWGGLGDRSPQWGVLGDAPDMAFAMLALRYARPLGAPDEPGALPRFEWTVDLVPVARMSPPLVSLRGSGLPCRNAVLCVEQPSGVGSDRFPPGSSWGFGFTPVGITRRFRTSERLSPFVGVNGGVLYFDRRVPTTKASRFNFTASAEVGVRLGPPGEPGLTLSYRFHHISNAGTAGENPGLASHLIALGVHRPLRGG